MRLLRPLSDFLLVHHRAIAGVCACFLDLDRLDTRLAKQGSHYALMIRAAPIAPFAITSYGLAPDADHIRRISWHHARRSPVSFCLRIFRQHRPARHRCKKAKSIFPRYGC